MFNEITVLFNKKNFLTVSASLMMLGIVGCGSDNKPELETEPEPQVKVTTGIWSAPAYGVAANITDTNFSFYQFTSVYCQKWPIDQFIDIDFDSFIQSIEVSEDGMSMETTIAQRKTPGMVMQKQDVLPQQCIDNLVAGTGDASYEFNPERDFEIFWQTYKEHYAFFALEDIDWDEIYQSARNAINSSTTAQELFEIFAMMVAPLKDFHVDIINPNLGIDFSVSRKPDLETIAFIDFITINQIEMPLTEQQWNQFNQYYVQQIDSTLGVIFSEVADGEEVHFNNSETILWGRLNNNLGYLMINTMDASEISGSVSMQEKLLDLSSTFDSVLSDLIGMEGLIIDVRLNEGGDEFVSQYILARLTGHSFHAFSKQAKLGPDRTMLQDIFIKPKGTTQYLGPVAVLTSMSSESSAETFSLAMRERSETVLIGEATAGGFSDQLIKTLPHGLLYTLSNEYFLSVNGEEFEGVGVPVDIEQPFFTLEQREANLDFGLQSAMDWLTN